MFSTAIRKAVGPVDGGTDQAGRPRACLLIHLKPGVLQGFLTDGHGENHESGIPVVNFLFIGKIEGPGIPVRNLADDVAEGFHLAAGYFAESGLALDRPFPGLGKGLPQRRRRAVPNDKNLSVLWSLHIVHSITYSIIRSGAARYRHCTRRIRMHFLKQIPGQRDLAPLPPRNP